MEGQKTCVNDKCDPWHKNCEHRKERQKNKHGNKEAFHCCPVERTDWYLRCYLVLMKTVKWPKKVVLYLLNCTLFHAFIVYRTLNTNKKVKYKNFLHEVGRSWISEDQNTTKSSSDDHQVPEKIRSEVKLNTWVNSALFHFTKGLVLINTTQWKQTILSTCSSCSPRLRSIICSVQL